MLEISLKSARINANLQQREVAEKLGVTVNTVVNWERGRTEPTVSQGKELSALYNIPFENLKFF